MPAHVANALSNYSLPKKRKDYFPRLKQEYTQRANGTREIPGYTTYFDGSLSTPYVRELTLGYGMQFARGLVRADLVARDWRSWASVLPSVGSESESGNAEITRRCSRWRCRSGESGISRSNQPSVRRKAAR